MSTASQTLPAADVTEFPPAGAFAPTGAAEIVVIAGPSSKGPLNSPRLIGARNTKLLTDTFGCGPAVKEAAYGMSRFASNVVFLRLATAIVTGSVGTVTVVRDDASDFTYATSGVPQDGADVLIACTLGGITGAGPISYTVSFTGDPDDAGEEIDLGTDTTIVVLGVTIALGSSKIITTDDTIALLLVPGSSAILPLTEKRVASSTSAVTITGTPNDAYRFRFEVLVGGTRDTAGIRYRYCLDWDGHEGTFTGSKALGIATSVDLIDGPISAEPTGINIAFGAGTLDPLDAFEWNTTQPAYDSGGLTAALTGTPPSTGLINWNGQWTWVRLVGPCTESLAAAADGIVSGWDSAHKPAWAVVDYRDRGTYESLAACSQRFQADFAAYTSTHVGVAYGLSPILCPINGRHDRRSSMCAQLPRAMAYPIQVDWAQYDRGPLTSDVTLTNASNVTVEHDSNADPGPNAMGAITLRHWPRKSGVYPTRAALMGPDDDIQLIPLRRVMNRAKDLQIEVQQLQVCKDFRANLAGVKDPLVAGDLVAADQAKINRLGRELIGAGLKGMISGFTFTVNPTPIDLGGGSSELRFALQITALVYVVTANGTAQFVSAKLTVS